MRKIVFGLCLVLFIALSGCGIDNTMYNAKRYFKAAQERPLTAQGRPSNLSVNDYTKAIQKCGIILSENSKGPKAEDALFLMARALYYKKNSAFQAKDAFESLITGYPESRHIPEAHLYLAKVLRDVHQIEESERILQRFIHNPKYRKEHPKALLLLADFEIKDQDYHNAQYWLKRILSDYSNSKEYREAFFLVGKNYYVQGDYEQSLQEFKTFLKTKGLSKEKKLEAQYYIAANQFELGMVDESLKGAKQIIRNDWRPEQLAKAKLLLARIQLYKGNTEAGIEGFEEVIKSYPRTESSAYANYYWGNYLYNEGIDRDKAAQNLGRVKTEAPNLDIAPLAQKKADAIRNTKLVANLDPNKKLQEYLNAHYLRAESFARGLALPDSAIATYYIVISQRDSLVYRLETINEDIANLAIQRDSLLVKAAELDSLIAISLAETELDNIVVAAFDSLGIEPIQRVDADSLVMAELEVEKPNWADSLTVVNSRITQLNDEIATKELSIGSIENALERFDREILPFCYYSIFSILWTNEATREDSESIYELLQTNYPKNLYSRAAKSEREGKIPSFIDPAYEEALQEFDRILSFYPAEKDSLVIGMQSFAEGAYKELQTWANYRLGWYYSFEEPDSLLAVQYLDKVLEDSDNAKFSEAVRRFYNGKKYLHRDPADIEKLYMSAPAELIPASKETLTSKADEEGDEDEVVGEADVPDEPLEIGEDELGFEAEDSPPDINKPIANEEEPKLDE